MTSHRRKLVSARRLEPVHQQIVDTNRQGCRRTQGRQRALALEEARLLEEAKGRKVVRGC